MRKSPCCKAYLPAQLSDAEIDALIADTIAATGATSIKDMGKVMGLIKGKAQGRADMAVVGAKIKVQARRLIATGPWPAAFLRFVSRRHSSRAPTSSTSSAPASRSRNRAAEYKANAARSTTRSRPPSG